MVSTKSMIGLCMIAATVLLLSTAHGANAQFPSMFGQRGMMDPFFSSPFRSKFGGRNSHLFGGRQPRFFETQEERQARLNREAAARRQQKLQAYEKQLLNKLSVLGQYERKYDENLQVADGLLKDHVAKEEKLKTSHDLTLRELNNHRMERQRIDAYVSDQSRRKDAAIQQKEKFVKELEAVRSALQSNSNTDSPQQQQQHQQQLQQQQSQHLEEEREQQRRWKELQRQKQEEQHQRLRLQQQQREREEQLRQQQQREREQKAKEQQAFEQKFNQQQGNVGENPATSGPVFIKRRVIRRPTSTPRSTSTSTLRDYEVDADGNKWQAGGIWVGETNERNNVQGDVPLSEHIQPNQKGSAIRETAEPSDAEMVAEILDFLKQRGFRQ